MLRETRLDQEQLPGSLGSAIEQAEGSLRRPDTASQQEGVDIGEDHYVPLVLQEAPGGTDDHASILHLAATGGEEPDRFA